MKLVTWKADQVNRNITAKAQHNWNLFLNSEFVRLRQNFKFSYFLGENDKLNFTTFNNYDFSLCFRNVCAVLQIDLDSLKYRNGATICSYDITIQFPSAWSILKFLPFERNLLESTNTDEFKMSRTSYQADVNIKYLLTSIYNTERNLIQNEYLGS